VVPDLGGEALAVTAAASYQLLALSDCGQRLGSTLTANG
jgi:hypothetical protein